MSKSERLGDLARASEELVKAKMAYQDAILACREMGIPNTKIAATVGRSETAIRLFLKRRGLHGRN